MDPRERLRLALLGAGCARCGQPYAAQGITVLAQRQEMAFVQLVCFACQSETLALVAGVSSAAEDEQEATAGAPTMFGPDLPIQTPGPAGRGEAAPIGERDVLRMRTFLASYEGDIAGLFEAARESDEPDGDGPA